MQDSNPCIYDLYEKKSVSSLLLFNIAAIYISKKHSKKHSHKAFKALQLVPN